MEVNLSEETTYLVYLILLKLNSQKSISIKGIQRAIEKRSLSKMSTQESEEFRAVVENLFYIFKDMKDTSQYGSIDLIKSLEK